MATIQQPRLPETVVNCAFDLYHRSAPWSASDAGVATFTCPEQTGWFTEFSYNTVDTDMTQRIDVFVFVSKLPVAESRVAVYNERDHVTNQKLTYPNSRFENAGKRLRNIRSLAFISPFKALTIDPMYLLVIVGDTELSLCTQTSAFINNTIMTPVVCLRRLQQ